MRLEAIYPYIVPEAYRTGQSGADDLMKPLGHGVYFALVEERECLAKSVSRDDMSALGLTLEDARAQALRNLEELLEQGAIEVQAFPDGPAGQPFIYVGGHWAAAACALLPGLHALAKQHLRDDHICLSIPHRGALLIFKTGDRAYRDEMRAMIQKNEGDQPKLLTFGLFTCEGPKLLPLEE